MISCGTSGSVLPETNGLAAVPPVVSPDVSRELNELASSSDSFLPRSGELCDLCATPLLVLDSPTLTRGGCGVSLSSFFVWLLVFLTIPKKVMFQDFEKLLAG